MKRITSFLGKRSSSPNSSPTNGDSPEADVARGVRLFCESGGPNNTGEEVLHLPVIVDSAESSPAAAKEAARLIRKFLSKDNFQRAYVQYNAIMLIRILADNPGQSFTRNVDAKFVATVKELLRDGRDMSVQQILRETLDTFEMQRAQDETLSTLISMWTSEKAKWSKKSGNNIGSGIATNGTGSHTLNAPPFVPGQNQPLFYRPRHHHRERGLPPPQELASRIEEARTSSKLLTQVVQSTPPQEILGNDLVKEFAERCQSASRSIQGFINADNPAPDEDTLLTLIETNDGLATALSKHQRSILQARKFGSASPAAQPFQPPRAPVEAPTPAPVQAPPTHDFVSPLQSPDFEPPVAAPAGPPPRLGMPKRVEKLENPFDDSNQANGSSSFAGPSTQPNHLTPGQSNHAAAHGDMTDEEEDSPAPVRQYRF